MMGSTGLLVLTQPLSHLRSLIPKVMEEAAIAVSDTLYICLQPAVLNKNQALTSLVHPLTNSTEVQKFAQEVYLTGSSVCHNLDVRVLLGHIGNTGVHGPVECYSLSRQVSVLLSDSVQLKETWTDKKPTLMNMMQAAFKNIAPDVNFKFINATSQAVPAGSGHAELLKVYPNVVMGGTFDRLHAGHKLLLTEGCLRCENMLTIGITDGERNKKKLLWELMQAYRQREQGVQEFVSDVKPSILLEPVQIFDPFGPTIERSDFQCLVVSQETRAGGDAVNAEREKRGFPALDLVVIDLVDDACHTQEEEAKVSSSSLRGRLLGTLIQPLKHRPSVGRLPYRVGVTGGIASGKSNICAELERLGAKVINCDLLGHKAYVPGTAAFREIVQEFGPDVVSDGGEIDRKRLGSIVFSDKSKLDKLNSIVWPAIRALVEEEIEQHRKAGVEVVMLEAAVLLEAGWDDMTHEVWVAFVPRDEAVKRVMDRNGLSEDEAQKRLSAQISNEERIAQANVVICPLWEFEVTRSQIKKAWTLMQQRMKNMSLTKL